MRQTPLEQYRLWIESLPTNRVITARESELFLQAIAFLQYERMAHLHVLIGVIVMELLSLILLHLSPSVASGVLVLLFLGLTIPYLIHYYFLETTIQNWYERYRTVVLTTTEEK